LKSLITLWNKIAEESAIWCNTSATMDCKTVQGRVNHEGLSFLTITLPTYGNDLQKGLSQGYVDHNLFQGFAWKGGLPKFLSGFLGLVFNSANGVLLDSPSEEAILCIRQLTLMFAKINLPCSPERERAAFDGFVKCEQDVRSAWTQLEDPLKREFQLVSNVLYGTMFTKMDQSIRYGDLVPKHGPGAVAERYSSNEKYFKTGWTARLEDVFPSGDFIVPSDRFWQSLSEVDILEPGSEIPVRVISVPKTLKAPRIIGIEPAAMQYAQQSILERFREVLRDDNLVSKMIGIDDQVPNQDMARQGASDGTLATLDLSEASDRVSNQHVRLLTGFHGSLRAAMDATRSRKADIPGHGVKRLAKYASMGSATCFPMEACVFLTLVFMGIARTHNTPVTRDFVKKFTGQVRVFGDDIIVPVDTVNDVITVLETFGFVVNRNKSFWTGRFRESCGKDYYGSSDVSVTRVRRLFPNHITDVAETISVVSLRNQLYKAGFWSTTKWLDEWIEKKIKFFPTVHESSPVLGRHTFLEYETQRMCPDLHRPLVKGYVVKGRPPVDKLDGHGALVKYLLKRGLDPLDADHLERSGRPQAVYTKLRWCPPF